MIFVGIDVAKDKHDCFILNSEGTVLADVFTIANNRIGFETLLSRIQSCSQGESKIKVGLEATGHYSYNLLGFLLDSGLATYVINPLHTNLYRKSLSLRRTKTDRIDARTIAMMLMSDVDLKSYSNTAYHNEELKSLTRYRFDKVKERAKLKSSVARLVNILFPELEKLVSSLHIAVVYALLSNYPGASYIANANTEELAETLCTASKGRYTKSKTAEIQVAAGVSIGSKMPAKSMELKHTIALIRELDKEISEVESAIDKITSQMDSPIFTIPGIGRHMGAMILAEVGDFSNFASADKLLAYAGLSPSTYQSGQGRGPLYQIHGGLPFSHRCTGAPGADEKYPYPLLAKATASQAIPQAGKGGCKAERGCGWENCHSHRTPDCPGSGICQKSSRRCRDCGALCVTPVCYAVLFLYHAYAGERRGRCIRSQHLSLRGSGYAGRRSRLLCVGR